MKIFITGVCGTVGSELIKQLVSRDEANNLEIVAIDNNESSLFFMAQHYNDYDNVSLYVADIRDKDDMIQMMKGVNLVFHIAALKHVILNEFSPNQSVYTNIIGLQNIINSAHINKVKKVIFTSSDKAVNPTNVMGTSKLMGERLISAANINSENSEPIFSSTRFGNVLGSNGSVVQIFKKQIAHGGPVTLTDKNMTRFVMNVKDSVRLILDSAELAKGGEVFITKMPIIRISDLAQVMIDGLAPLYGLDPLKIKIIEIGPKAGEKLYEELMTEEESTRTIELKNYFSVMPAFRGAYKKINYDYDGVVNYKVKRPYVSKDNKFMSKDDLLKFLLDSDLLEI
jgi:FlaA1/EpsC-like NDP-sugar epimerase